MLGEVGVRLDATSLQKKLTVYVKEFNAKQRRIFDEVVDDYAVDYAFNWDIARLDTHAFCYVVPNYLRNLTVSKDRRDTTFTPWHVLKTHNVIVERQLIPG